MVKKNYKDSNKHLLPISVIIITKNSQLSIKKTLESVTWANEIIVIDSNSSDDTVKICRSFHAVVKKSLNWPGFGAQKNKALSLAKNRWILSIDSDEVVSKNLANEIRRIVRLNPKGSAFNIERINFFCNQQVKYSGWQNDYVIRLFPKKGSAFTKDQVHEKIIFEGSLHKIYGPILHYSYRNLDDVTDKIHRYSSAAARDLLYSEKKITLRSALYHSFWAFFKTYFVRFGFLDGKIGLIIAFMNMETTFYKYVKAIELKSYYDQ